VGMPCSTHALPDETIELKGEVSLLAAPLMKRPGWPCFLAVRVVDAVGLETAFDWTLAAPAI